MDDLERLSAFVNRDSATRRVFDGMGFLVMEPDQFDTWADCPPPPDGGTAFASTGGESEYYLMPDGSVVLYVPLADTPYVVVGRDLREFLALAVDVGFVLDGLAYDWERAFVEMREQPFRDSVDDDRRRLLDELSATFDLRPGADVQGRLTELRALTPGAPGSS